MIEPTRFSLFAEVFGLLTAFFASAFTAARLRRTWRPAVRPEGGRRAPLLAAGRRRKPPTAPAPASPPVPPSSGLSAPPAPPSGSPPVPPSGSPPVPPSGSPPEEPGDGAPPQLDQAIALSLMRLFGVVLRVVLRCGVPRGDASDVAQAVILHAIPLWPSLPIPPDELEGKRRRAYLARMAIGFASKYHAAAAKNEERAAHIERARFPDLAPSAEDIALDLEANAERAAEVAIEDLRAATTPDAWRAFYAYVVEGLPALAIARLEGIPRATVYNRLRLARRDLRAAVERKRAQRATERQLMARPRKGVR